MKSAFLWVAIFLSGCSLGVDQQPSPESQAEISASKLAFKTQLERRLLVELWIHLTSQKESLQRDLLDTDLSDEEQTAIVEVLQEIDEQLALTLTAIGDD